MIKEREKKKEKKRRLAPSLLVKELG